MKFFIILSIALAANSASASTRFDGEYDEVQECPPSLDQNPFDLNIKWPEIRDIFKKYGSQNSIQLVDDVEKNLQCALWHKNRPGKN